MPRIYGLTNQERSGDLKEENRYQKQNCKFNIVHFGDQMMANTAFVRARIDETQNFDESSC